MTDFTQPINTSLVSTVLETLRNRDRSIATMDYASDTNITVGFMRYNRPSRVLEEFDGSVWVEQRVEPAGIVKAFAGTTAPRGHILCDGGAISRTAYPSLFTAIGTTYGAGNGSTTFNVPNLSGRFPLGKATTGTGSTLAATGGAIDHNHTTPAHYHGMGSGADLNVNSSGTHSTVINISHGHTATTVAGASGVSIANNTTGATNLTINDQGHIHAVAGVGTTTEGGGQNTGNSPTKFAKGRITNNGPTGDHNGSTLSATSNISITNGNHAHPVSITDPGHGHTTTVDALVNPYYAQDYSGVHTHAAANFAGRIGLVSGGLDGNTNMLGGTNNPPFLVLNYIITI